MKKFIASSIMIVCMVIPAHASEKIVLSDYTQEFYDTVIRKAPYAKYTLSCVTEAMTLYKMSFPLMNVKKRHDDNIYLEVESNGDMTLTLDEGEFLHWDTDNITCSPNSSGGVIVETTKNFGFKTTICEPVYVPGCLEKYKKWKKDELF